MGGFNLKQQQQHMPKVSPRTPGLLGSAPRHSAPGFMSTQSTLQQGIGKELTGKNWTPNFSSSTSQGNNSSSFGGANFGNQSKLNFPNKALLQGKPTPSPLGFSQDVDLRQLDGNQRSSAFSNSSPASMATKNAPANQMGLSSTSSLFPQTAPPKLTGVPPPSLGGSIAPNLSSIPPPSLGGNLTSIKFPNVPPPSLGGGSSPLAFSGVSPPSLSGISTRISTTSSLSGIPPPSHAGAHTSTLGFVGVPPPPLSSGGALSGVPPPSGKGAAFSQSGLKSTAPATSSSNYNPWQNQGPKGPGGDDVRKRKLQDELAEFEMQVGPSKQRKSGAHQVRPHGNFIFSAIIFHKSL